MTSDQLTCRSRTMYIEVQEFLFHNAILNTTEDKHFIGSCKAFPMSCQCMAIYEEYG